MIILINLILAFIVVCFICKQITNIRNLKTCIALQHDAIMLLRDRYKGIYNYLHERCCHNDEEAIELQEYVYSDDSTVENDNAPSLKN